MKITLITVCFNCKAHIADTLRSVEAQTWPEIEHLIVDGGSSDGTLAVIADHTQPWRRVSSEPDRGIYDAMNKGLRLATGDLIGFLNADDILAHSGVVASIAQAALQNPSADAIYGDLVYVRQDRPDKVLRYWRSGKFTRARLRFGWMPPHPTFFLRSSRLASVGLFNDSLTISADYDFMLRCLSGQDARAVHVPDVLVRMRAGGASNRSLKALASKSIEDLHVLRENHVGGWFTLMCKNFRKLPQFL